MDDRIIIQESIGKIFKQHGWPSVSGMTQRNFEHLSSELYKKSGILISGVTIKRLANGNFSRMPQIATLNAIANYFDFENWEEYKASLDEDESQLISGAREKSLKKSTKLLRGAFLGLVLTVLVLGILYFSPRRPTIKNIQKVSLSAHKTTANQLPNTVIFNYNIDEVEADSFFIQQSWDKNRRVRIYKNNYTLTDIYYEPGYHTAKLIANDSIIKTVPVDIPTNGWFFYANEYKSRYQTEYIKVLSPYKDGYLHITTDDLTRNGVRVDREKMYLYSLFSERLNVSGDNLKLRTRVRMKEISNNFCSYIILELYSRKHFILVKSTSKGCASEAMLSFAEKKISGRNTDLTSTTYNVTEWTEIEVDVKNKHFTLYINGKKSFKGDYRADMKSITGLSFISNGLCEVEYIELKGQNGKVAYKSNFKDSVQ